MIHVDLSNKRRLLGVAVVVSLLYGCAGEEASVSPTPTPQAAAAAEEPEEVAAEEPAGDGPAEEEEAAVGDDERPAGMTGELTTDAGVWAFAPSTCVIFEDEIEINGPATTPDGEPAYVDLSVMGGESGIRIQIGSDEQFSDSGAIDTTLVAGTAVTEDLELTVEGSRVRGAARFVEDDYTEAGTGTFGADCG